MPLQGAADPGGEQVGPGGAQQHGDHPAHHEPVLGHRNLRGGKAGPEHHLWEGLALDTYRELPRRQ